MLEVKVSLIPFGDERGRRELGTIRISNTGKHPQRPEYGEYTVDYDGGSFVIPEYRRDRGFGVWCVRLFGG